MPIILHLETSTPVCSVAISNGDTILALRETDEHNSHSSHISLFIQECLQASNVKITDIDAVAVSSGPGSYTGLRIGYSTAKGICYAIEKPLIQVDTLLSLAHGTKNSNDISSNSYICPMIDARRMEVYMTLFDHNFNEIEKQQALILEKDSFGKFFDIGINVIFCGNGAFKVPAIIEHQNAVIHSTKCSAQHMITLANLAFENNHFEDVAYVTPSYLKSPFITKPRKRL